MRASIFLWLCFSLALRTHAQAPFCRQVDALTHDPSVAGAHWGISVRTLEGVTLCGIHDAQLFRPASNAKLFTAAAALALLGPAYTVKTVVTGDLSPDGEIRGDLTLVGAGDANLSERTIPYTPLPPEVTPRNPLERLADQLAALRVHHVTGDLIGDDSLWAREPYPADWAVGDTVWGYGAPVSALSANDNEIALKVSPGPAVGSHAIVSFVPEIASPAMQIDVTTSAAKTATKIRVARLQGGRTLRINGSIAVGSVYTDELAVDDPASYTARFFRSLLEARRIRIDGTTRAEHRECAAGDDPGPAQGISKPALKTSSATPLASILSPTLLEDVTVTLKVSQNLHAELLLHQLGKAFGNDASAQQGLRAVRKFAIDAGVANEDFYLNDGSGLSTHDLTTPRALTQLLTYATRQPWFDGFKAALPVGGMDGTLASRFLDTALKGKVFAKTGSLGESRALSGYVTTATGKTLIFSILDDNHLPETNTDRVLMDRIVDLIARQN